MRALLIPADINEPLEWLTLADERAIEDALDGPPYPLKHPSDPAVRAYRAGPPYLFSAAPGNLRATRLFATLSVEPAYLCGNLVVVGFDPASGEERDCPENITQALTRPISLDQPTRVATGHGYECRWPLEDADGSSVYVALDVRRLPTDGAILEPRHYAASLRVRWELPDAPPATGTRRFEPDTPGLSLVREQVPEFTSEGLEQFIELAITRVIGLAAGGDEHVVAYFR